MSVKTKEFTVEVPQYLYDESVKLTNLGLLRAQIRERRAKYGYEEPSEEEILAELRATRREIWKEEYRPRYSFGAG